MKLGCMNMNFKNILIAFLFLCSSVSYAQSSRALKGIVWEEVNGKNEPIVGVNVTIANEQNRTLIGTVTDINGKYSLLVPESTGKLKIVFSFIGMKPITYDYAGQNTLNVVMAAEVHTLQDVVVTA